MLNSKAARVLVLDFRLFLVLLVQVQVFIFMFMCTARLFHIGQISCFIKDRAASSFRSLNYLSLELKGFLGDLVNFHIHCTTALTRLWLFFTKAGTNTSSFVLEEHSYTRKITCDQASLIFFVAVGRYA